MKRSVWIAAAGLFAIGCQPQSNPPESQIKVSSVQHSPVKRQSIGNCWLYALSTWLEAMQKVTEGRDVNVSETYWTYWDLYHKLLEKEPVPEEELNTGGSWARAKAIVQKHGWVEEAEFIPNEDALVMSKAQKCAQDYIMEQGKEGGTLFDPEARTPELVRAELDKGFSCNGTLTFSMDEALAKARATKDTMLKDQKTGEIRSLEAWMGLWKEARSPGYTNWGPYEGKKLGTQIEFDSFKKLEQRIKAALNDHYPVVISFYVTFNAPDKEGVFNLDTLSRRGEIGKGGGHMLVLHDYAVKDVPGFDSLGEGDLDPELKAQAMNGNLTYIVAKNSWGYDRPDRPWLKNGYSRFTWDYLTARYYDEENKRFAPFLRGVVLPPGY